MFGINKLREEINDLRTAVLKPRDFINMFGGFFDSAPDFTSLEERIENRLNSVEEDIRLIKNCLKVETINVSKHRELRVIRKTSKRK